MGLTHKDMDSTQTEVKAMEDLRKKVEEVFPEELAFPYSFVYLGWETNKVRGWPQLIALWFIARNLA